MPIPHASDCKDKTFVYQCHPDGYDDHVNYRCEGCEVVVNSWDDTLTDAERKMLEKVALPPLGGPKYAQR